MFYWIERWYAVCWVSFYCWKCFEHKRRRAFTSIFNVLFWCMCMKSGFIFHFRIKYVSSCIYDFLWYTMYAAWMALQNDCRSWYWGFFLWANGWILCELAVVERLVQEEWHMVTHTSLPSIALQTARKQCSSNQSKECCKRMLVPRYKRKSIAFNCPR